MPNLPHQRMLESRVTLMHSKSEALSLLGGISLVALCGCGGGGGPAAIVNYCFLLKKHKPPPLDF